MQYSGKAYQRPHAQGAYMEYNYRCRGETRLSHPEHGEKAAGFGRGGAVVGSMDWRIGVRGECIHELQYNYYKDEKIQQSCSIIKTLPSDPSKLNMKEH